MKSEENENFHIKQKKNFSNNNSHFATHIIEMSYLLP